RLLDSPNVGLSSSPCGKCGLRCSRRVAAGRNDGVRAVVQRVSQASVWVDGTEVGAIDGGLCILPAACPDDGDETARHLAERIATLRVFPDAAGKMNLDLAAAGGEALVVSQFTLFADTSRGHRPSFIGAG